MLDKTSNVVTFPKPRQISPSEKLNWVDAMMADHRLDPMDRLVGYWIAQCLNRERGTAYVSDKTLADKAGVSIRSVSDARKALRAAGWIKWRRTSKANIYTLLNEPMAAVVERQKELKAARDHDRSLRDSSPLSDLDSPTVTDLDRQTSADLKAVEQLADDLDRQTLADLDMQTLADLDRQTSAESPGRDIPVESPGRKKERDSLASNAESDRAIQNGFEQWWANYPKQVARAGAEKAYHRVIKTKQATESELLAGVMRYAEERMGQDPKYTAHAATWLNAGRWLDEPTRETYDPRL
jgi:hypothetical protein